MRRGKCMKTTERVEQAFKRVKELLMLVKYWTEGNKNTDVLAKELKDRKKELVKDLYVQLAALDDRFMFTHKSEFKTKEYIVQYDNIKKQIKELEK